MLSLIWFFIRLKNTSILLKYNRYYPDHQTRKVFNDILGFRAFCDSYDQILEEKFSPDGAYYFARARACGVPVSLWQAGGGLSGYDFVVDCIFGTGFHGEVRGIAADAIRAINASGAFVVSADINSGMNGDTGEGALCVVSSLTVSIGFYQPGHFRGREPEVIGRLTNCDIGILPLGEILEYR